MREAEARFGNLFGCGTLIGCEIGLIGWTRFGLVCFSAAAEYWQLAPTMAQ